MEGTTYRSTFPWLLLPLAVAKLSFPTRIHGTINCASHWVRINDTASKHRLNIACMTVSCYTVRLYHLKMLNLANNTLICIQLQLAHPIAISMFAQWYTDADTMLSWFVGSCFECVIQDFFPLQYLYGSFSLPCRYSQND